LAEIPGLLAPLFAAFRTGRQPGEAFGDWAARELLAPVPA
jgi:sulfite reductase beta subunit-like hemoprotein